MSLIATTIVGTLIEQGASEEQYLSYYTENTYRIIKFFGLNDTYHSFWFYALAMLFAINLTLCTTRRLARLVRERRQTALPDAVRLGKMEFNFPVVQGKSQETLEKIKKSYKLIHEKEEGTIFEKGIISRYSVFIIHGSILIVLAGGPHRARFRVSRFRYPEDWRDTQTEQQRETQVRRRYLLVLPLSARISG